MDEPVGGPSRATVTVPDYPDRPEARLRVLTTGDIDVRGRMPWSSNATFLVHACGPDGEVLAVYKPERGERPLWDFPPGLWRREIAAHRLAVALGWELVPPTVARPDAPFGPGSLQLFVPFDPEAHYFSLYEDPANHDALRRLAVFDVLANSADRKGGHVLHAADGHIWAIDNGLSFHQERKLRTVIWEFGGEVMDHDVLAPVQAIAEAGLPDDLACWLDDDEQAALLRRARAVAADRLFPIDHTGRAYPWPLV